MSAIYSTGTASVVAGSTVVTGAGGPAWSMALLPGDMFNLGGLSVPIAGVTGSAQLTLAYGWPGASAAGAAYAVQLSSPERSEAIVIGTRVRKLTESAAILNFTAPCYRVLAANQSTPPTARTEGDTYVIGPVPTGEWAGQANNIVRWNGAAWDFTAPDGGWMAYSLATQVVYLFRSAWGPVSDAAVADVIAAAITARDAASGFADAALTRATAAGDSAALALTRANAAAGSATAASNYAAAAAASAASVVPLIRERLTADRTYYVSATGNNANNGLSTGAPFSSMQHAANIAAQLDCNGFKVKIKVMSSLYGESIIMTRPLLGSSSLLEVEGNIASPGSVVITGVSSDCFRTDGPGCALRVQGVEMRVISGSGNCLNALGGSRIEYGNVRFGACTGIHVNADQRSFMLCIASYAIVGGAVAHWHSPSAAQIIVAGMTITLTGTPNFSAYFAGTAASGFIQVPGNTFVGTATGLRFLVHKLAVIDTGTGVGIGDPSGPSNPNYLPGDVAGIEYNGGRYF
ncbi:DUF2793 domain-containing protein [Ancylobacter sp. VNQ12]|uniref:DUF2793 domain-containing protein n=1 Tax=Ancylobacter sp. VNQ12 TaxID=3400920 RepID=UPI003BFD71EC